MRFLFIIPLVCAVFFCDAQKSNLQHIDDLLAKYEQRNRLMGSVSIALNGTIVYAKTMGSARLKPLLKADTLTKYRIGSISKTFTACMIMQLVAEKKLSLTDKLARFFPTWPNADKITMEHLLRHESGIFNFGKSTDKKYQNINPKTRHEAFAVFESAPIAFVPGKKVDYNNANYLVLSFIIEALDKTTFAESLDTRILKPLALKNTNAGGPINDLQSEALCYFWQNGWIDDSDFNNESLLGAGAIVSSPSDVNVFMNALFTYQLLPEPHLLEMLNMKNGMGLGLNQFPFYTKTAFGHAGNLAAFESFTAYFPAEKVSFTLCLNGNREDFNDVLKAILEAYFNL